MNLAEATAELSKKSAEKGEVLEEIQKLEVYTACKERGNSRSVDPFCKNARRHYKRKALPPCCTAPSTGLETCLQVVRHLSRSGTTHLRPQNTRRSTPIG
jgi:hypothetical protein